MNRRLLVFLLLWVVSAAPGEATVLGCESLDYSSLRFEHWSNHCRRSDLRMLYYSGLMEALNTYVERRQAEGALETKPFEIAFFDPTGDMPAPLIEVDQDANAYHVVSRNDADLNLRQLVRIVEYFTLGSWHRFPQFDSGKLDDASYWEQIQREAERLYRALDAGIGEPDLSFFRGRASVVAEVGQLEVVYEDDRLSYVLTGEALDLEPADPVPVKVKDRYLLGTEGALVVFEKGVEVARQVTSWKECLEPPRAKTDRESVRIGCDWDPRQYTYLYGENRFQEDENGRDGAYTLESDKCGQYPCGVHPTAVRVTQEEDG